MASKYSINELQFRGGGKGEQARTRKIFEDLKSRADKGKKLSEHEKNFFCNGLSLSKLNDGALEAYPCCENFKFKYLYLTYFYDLSGGSKYRKIGLNAKSYFVPPAEAQKDLDYLIDLAEEWDLVVAKDPSDQLLLQTNLEARKDIRTLDNQPFVKADPYAKGKFVYRYKKWAILLHFKWVYCFGLEYFEATDPSDLILTINEETIEFTEFSLIHILNRHYSQITKQYITDKTFHNEDFKPRILSSQLKVILNEIDDSKLLTGKSINKIAFKFNNVQYLLWTETRTKSVKGKGNVSYRRLETFYPVTDPKEKSRLSINYALKKLREGLEVYIEN